MLQELCAMGFDKSCVERALAVYEENYDTDYKPDRLIEIVLQLMEKEGKKKTGPAEEKKQEKETPQVAALQKENRALKQRLAQFESEMEATRQHLQEISADHDKKVSDMEAALKKSMSANTDVQKQQAQLEQKWQAAMQEKERMEGEMQKMRGEIQKMLRVKVQMEENIAQTQEKNEQEKDRLRADMAKMKSGVQNELRLKSDMEKLRSQMQSEIEKNALEKNQLQRQRQEALQAKERLESEVEKLKADLHKVLQLNSNLESKLTQSQKRLGECERELDQVTRNRQETVAEKTKLESNVEKLKSEMKKLREEQKEKEKKEQEPNSDLYRVLKQHAENLVKSYAQLAKHGIDSVEKFKSKVETKFDLRQAGAENRTVRGMLWQVQRQMLGKDGKEEEEFEEDIVFL